MFKVGDKVEFELSVGTKANRPRWEHGRDIGGSNIWTSGTVVEVTVYQIVVHYTIEKHIGTGICNWPNLMNPDYIHSQWLRSGYLRKVKAPACECGGAAAKTTHSRWCPVYKEKNTGRK